MRATLSVWTICCLAVVAPLCSGCRFLKRDEPQAVKRMNFAPAGEAKPKPDRVAIARRLIEKGYYDVALAQLREATRDDRRDPKIPYLSGVCNRKEGRLKEAEDCFRRAIRMDSDFAAAYNGLGVTLYALGRREKARKAFIKAVFLDPGQADFQNNLGYCLLQCGELVEAEQHFRKSLALNPRFPLALHNLGACLVRMGREDDAFRVLCRAMTPAKAYNDIGVAYEQGGDLDRALACYRKAIKESPGLIEARRNASRVERSLIQDGKSASPSPSSTEPPVIPVGTEQPTRPEKGKASIEKEHENEP